MKVYPSTHKKGEGQIKEMRAVITTQRSACFSQHDWSFNQLYAHAQRYSGRHLPPCRVTCHSHQKLGSNYKCNTHTQQSLHLKTRHVCREEGRLTCTPTNSCTKLTRCCCMELTEFNVGVHWRGVRGEGINLCMLNRMEVWWIGMEMG